MSEWIDAQTAQAKFLATIEGDNNVTANSLGEEQNPTDEGFDVTVKSLGVVNDLMRVRVNGIPSNRGYQQWTQNEEMHPKNKPLSEKNIDLFREVLKINAVGCVADQHQAQWYTIGEFESNYTYDSKTQLKNDRLEMALEEVKKICAFYLDEPEDNTDAALYYERLEQYIKEYGLKVIRYIDELIWDGLNDQSAFMVLELFGSISDVVTKSIRREIILKCLSHEHAAIRLGAINGIACLGDNGLIPVLEQHIQQDSSEVVLRACERVLQYLTRS